MIVVGVREAKDSLGAILDDVQTEEVVITRHGKPVALVTGIEGKDMEDIYGGLNDELHASVEKSRTSGRMIPWEEAKRRLGL
jgi:prevent-host-death family protein